MFDVRKITGGGMILDQKGYNSLMKECIESAKDNHERVFYEKKLSGGNCCYCKEPWIKDYHETQISRYVAFIPGCKCYEERNKKIEIEEAARSLLKYCGIPDEYLSSTVKMMSKDVSEEILMAMEKTKKYISEGMFKNRKGCVWFGDVGTGKTHMAVSIFRYLVVTKGLSGKFINCSDIITKIIKSSDDFIESLIKYDVIVLDDMDKMYTGQEKKNAWVKEKIFSLFNNLTSKKKIILGTTNCKNNNEFEKMFDPAVVSRLIGSCILIQMVGNDYRIKKAKDERF